MAPKKVTKREREEEPEDSSSETDCAPPKKARQNYPPATVAILKACAKEHLDEPNTTKEEIERLATECKLKKKQVRQWMTNARRRYIPDMKEERRLEEERRREAMEGLCMLSDPQYIRPPPQEGSAGQPSTSGGEEPVSQEGDAGRETKATGIKHGLAEVCFALYTALTTPETQTP